MFYYDVRGNYLPQGKNDKIRTIVVSPWHLCASVYFTEHSSSVFHIDIVLIRSNYKISKTFGVSRSQKVPNLLRQSVLERNRVQIEQYSAASAWEVYCVRDGNVREKKIKNLWQGRWGRRRDERIRNGLSTDIATRTITAEQITERDYTMLL